MTLTLVGAFAYGFLDNMIPADVFVPVVGIAVAFYFGARSA